MPDYNTTRAAKGAKPKAKDTEILAKARADWDRAYERDRSNIRMAYDDLSFLAGEQWPEKQRTERENDGRPVLVDNRLPQFVHQITGDIRQMKPSIKVVPVDDQSDEKVADIFGGLIRYIENRSDAQAVYFRAADSQVAAGVGHWRIATEYADDSTFNQEIRIAPIEDGVSVLWDPDSTLPTREDAKFCFVPVDVSRKAFEVEYPDVQPSEFDDEKWVHNNEWVTDDYVRLAEYWVKKPSRRKLALGLDGSIADVTDAEPGVIAYHMARGARIEERDSYKVCRYLITAGAILEGPQEWAGRMIPIVPVYGEEIRIGRKIIRSGIVRHAKDPQRMVNYFHSAHTESVALQPKAPFMVTELNIGQYQELWEQANTRNLPYLLYKPDQQNGGAEPKRITPPVSSQGISEGLGLAVESLKAVTGIYDASLGNRSNETSGKAILARQREGDVGSYVYIDNFARAIRHTGKILVDLIPHIYDTQRTIRIMGEDGALDVIEINKAKGIDPQTMRTVFENDVTVGCYDVVTSIGPSYTTKREEAREGMNDFVRAVPQAAPLILDLIAKAQDWPLADKIAARLRAGVPPAVLQAEEMEKKGVPPEQIQQMLQQAQQQPNPEVIKLQMENERHDADLQFKQAESQQKLAFEQQKHDQQMQFEREKHASEMQMRAQEMQINATLQARKQDEDAAVKREQIEASSRPIVQLDANDAVAQLNPALEQHMKSTSDSIAVAVQAMAQAVQGLANVTQSLEHVAEVMMAPTEIIRDQKTQRAIGARKMIQTGTN